MASYLPDTILQEIRTLLSLQCAEIVYNDLANGGKHDAQDNLYAKVFHGSEGEGAYISIATAFVNGEDPFDKCFSIHDIETNRSGNESRKSGIMLELKTLFHCDENTRYIVEEGGFNRAAIAFSKNMEVSGRTIREKASKAQATFKHALKHYNEWANMKNVTPSGQTIEDMALYVRRKLFVQFGGSKDAKSSKRAKVKVKTEEDMPSKWFFTGYFAFLLYCPIGLSGKSLSVISADGKNVTTESRAENRNKVVEIKKAEAATGTGGYVPENYRRGVSIAAKASAARLAQMEQKRASNQLNTLLLSADSHHANLLKELEFVTKQLVILQKQHDDDAFSTNEEIEELADELAYHKKWKRSLYKKLKVNSANKRSLEKQAREMMSMPPEKALLSFFDQVGSFSNQNAIDSSNKKQKTTSSGIQVMTPSSPGSSVLSEPDSISNDKAPVEEVTLRQPSQLEATGTVGTNESQISQSTVE